jgi:hypothetical protein
MPALRIASPFDVDYQRQLLKGGLFDAYNQWLLVPPNLTAFQTEHTHTDQYDEFNKFQKGRVFKVPPDSIIKQIIV